jgi:NADPH-dependent curcumin reductase CurA
LIQVVAKSLRLEGFLVRHHADLQPVFIKELSDWVGEGKIKWRETVEYGIESAPSAFFKLFKGENLGKMLVKLT